MEERFWPKVNKLGSNKCWEWKGYIAPTGYGLIYDRATNRPMPAHRASLIIAGQTLIQGLEVDHLCRNRKCVNPTHLEQVTHKENNLRGESPPAKAARRKECINGHPYTPENTYRYRVGYRRCKLCRAIQMRVSNRRKREISIKEARELEE